MVINALDKLLNQLLKIVVLTEVRNFIFSIIFESCLLFFEYFPLNCLSYIIRTENLSFKLHLNKK